MFCAAFLANSCNNLSYIIQYIGNFLYVLRCFFRVIYAIFCRMHYTGNFLYVLCCLFWLIYAIICLVYYVENLLCILR